MAILVSNLALAADNFTVDHLMKVQQVGQVKMSPDGDSIAFTRSVPRKLYVDKNGKPYTELYLVNDKGIERPYITGAVNVRAINWSPDGEYVYYLAKLKGDKFTSLYRIPVNGGESAKVMSLAKTNINGYQISPDGKQIALLAKPAKDKKEKKLKELGFKAEVYEEGLTNQQLFIADLAVAEKPLKLDALKIENYVSAMQWSPKADSMLIKVQPTALIDDKYMKSQWHVFDLKNQKITNSFVTEGKLGTAEFSYDGKHVAIIGAEDKHDPADGRLYLAKTDESKVTEWLPNYMGHVSDIEWANKSNTLYFTAHENTQTKLASLKVGSNKAKTLVKKGKIIAANISVSDSDKSIAVRGDSPKHANEVYLVRSKGKKVKRLTNSNPWLDGIKLAKQETVYH